MNIGIIFPHQLYEDISIYESCHQLIIIEEHLFFKQYLFHKQKIAFHRASMKSYESYLRAHQKEVIYIESISENSDIRSLLSMLHSSYPSITICYRYTNDHWLEKRIHHTCKKLCIPLLIHESKLFVTSRSEFSAYVSSKNKLLQNDFYIQTRKRLKILLENDQPRGGKWSFDEDNRLKYPSGKKAPNIFSSYPNPYLAEAYEYVENHFKNHHGKIDKRFQYAVNFEEAKKWLQRFLEERFNEFGTYEDAIVADEYALHHSILSPLLNVGLLDVNEVVQQAIKHAESNDISINQLEGFIRQIIGWREFINGVYEWRGVQQRNSNFFRHEQPMPAAFYNGTTGIPPIDHTIQKALNSAYNHHIERLMILSNFMLLCEISPNAIYQWYMELYIDAYDWVMVPNVYGMGQFADGGLMCTKPYISSSNYVLKMSNYKKGEWCDIWDALFWRFMNKHRDYLSKNFRLSMLIKTYDKMSEEKKLLLKNRADGFLEKLHSNNLLV